MTNISRQLEGLSSSLFRSRYWPWVLLAVVFIAGFFLRLWQYGWVANDDGVLYLYAARNYLDAGLESAIATYSWPFYSLLIAWVDKWIFNDLMVSAWALNFLFQSVQVFFIARICMVLGLKREQLFWLILLFLISTVFHNFRSYILRDQGFITCLTVGAFAGVCYVQNAKWSYYFLCLAAFAISILFRVEGAFLLLAGVLAMAWLVCDIRPLLVATVLISMSVAVEVVVLQTGVVESFYSETMGRVSDLSERLLSSQAIIEQRIFEKYWHDYSSVALWSMYLSTYIYFVVGSPSAYFFGLFYYKKRQWAAPDKLIAAFLIMILVYSFVYFLAAGFLVYRYILPLTYTVVLFALYQILVAANAKRFMARALLVVIVLMSLVKFLDQPSGSKRYLVDAQEHVERLGLDGPGVMSNAKQISLINGVPFDVAWKLEKKEGIIKKKIRRPLAADEVVVLYTYADAELELAQENCEVYSKTHRRRYVTVIAAKHYHCVP